MAMAAREITTRPPITPPTMAPTGVDEGVGVGFGVVGTGGFGVVLVLVLVDVEVEMGPELDLAWCLEGQAAL